MVLVCTIMKVTNCFGCDFSDTTVTDKENMRIVIICMIGDISYCFVLNLHEFVKVSFMEVSDVMTNQITVFQKSYWFSNMEMKYVLN